MDEKSMSRMKVNFMSVDGRALSCSVGTRFANIIRIKSNLPCTTLKKIKAANGKRPWTSVFSMNVPLTTQCMQKQPVVLLKIV